jgi:hypothetical protein
MAQQEQEKRQSEAAPESDYFVAHRVAPPRSSREALSPARNR